MPSNSEVDRHKALRKEAEKRFRAEEEARLPISKTHLVELFDHLDKALTQGCDHSLRFTKEFLNSHQLTETTIIPWLGEYGGLCDCEILANVEERWGESQ